MSQDYQSSETIVQYIFAFDFTGSCDLEIIPMIMREAKIPKQKALLLFEKAKLIWQERATLDELIQNTSQDYDFDRIGKVEKGILRYALFTLQDKEQTFTVVMKEAMRLAKKFSTPHAAKYVNAILDGIASTPSST